VVYNPFICAFDIDKRSTARQRIRENAGIPADAAVIGFFGALIDRKRPHILLQILQRMKRTADGRPIYGIVCGETLEPRDKLYFQMLRDENWQGRVVLPGFVKNVGDWMAACDVMIAPAIDEPLARVGVEAQSTGLPAIVSSDGGLREVVEDGISGLVVDPGDFEAWVAQVRRVLDDPDFARALSEGGLRSAAKLTVERHADAIDMIYDRLVMVLPSGPRSVRGSKTQR
jgi:glycosyltransferase involved in cell wall biosynthesis